MRRASLRPPRMRQEGLIKVFYIHCCGAPPPFSFGTKNHSAFMLVCCFIVEILKMIMYFKNKNP